MVRLKGKQLYPNLLYIVEFQFHDGSIKGHLLNGRLVNENSFNSTMVRLKDHLVDNLWNILLFQFHDGSIKGKKISATASWLIKFQFHDGSIKGVINFQYHWNTLKFQFHDGSIKGLWCGF